MSLCHFVLLMRNRASPPPGPPNSPNQQYLQEGALRFLTCTGKPYLAELPSTHQEGSVPGSGTPAAEILITCLPPYPAAASLSRHAVRCASAPPWPSAAGPPKPTTEEAFCWPSNEGATRAFRDQLDIKCTNNITRHWQYACALMLPAGPRCLLGLCMRRAHGV